MFLYLGCTLKHPVINQISELVLVTITLLIVFACRAEPAPIPNSPETIGAEQIMVEERIMCSYRNPSWSPDGHYLTFDYTRLTVPATIDEFHPASEIYVVNLDTGEASQLTNNDVADVEPDWSPNGTQIVYVQAGERLMIMSADGREKQVLLECPQICAYPTWSPDGTTVAFEMRSGLGEQIDGHIWVIGPDGKYLRQLTDKLYAVRPTWSMDGKRIAYEFDEYQSRGLAVLDITTGEENVLIWDELVVDPDWSPDGRLILYTLYTVSLSPTAPDTLYVVDAVGGEPHRLLAQDFDEDIFDAAWSPDGTKIAFAYGRTGGVSNLYILDLGKLPGSLTPSPLP